MGNAWSWGQYTLLGFDAGGQNKSTPTAIATDQIFTQLALANSGSTGHMLAIDDAGMVYGWGANSSGQLGDNSLSFKTSPVSLCRPSSYIYVSCGSTYSLVVDADGTAWAFGNNTQAQFGTGNNYGNYSSPISVLNGGSYKAVACGQEHSLFLMASGEIRVCGSPDYGRLGTNSTAFYTTPVSIARPGSYTKIIASSQSSYALDAAGLVWCWGRNAVGQLGDNTKTDRSSPVSINRAGSYIAIAAGNEHCMALDGATGAVWAWGRNFYGPLGTGNIIDYSSPVSVLGGRSYIAIAAGNLSSYALEHDGTIWAWGLGDNLQTGGNGTTSSPVSIAFADPAVFLASAPLNGFVLTAGIPEWSPTYPKTGTVGGTSSEFLVETVADSTAYLVIVPDGAGAPTSQQVKDGQDSSGTPVAAGFSGNVALTGGIEANIIASNLTSETAYDAYLVAESSALQDNAVLVNFTTTDITDPINAAGYPKLGPTVTEDSSSLLAKISENGTGYFVVVAKDAVAPSPTQVKNGQDSTGAAVAAGFSGSASLVANTEAEMLATNLAIGKQYDMYFIAEDASYNLQDAVSKVEISTLPKIISQINIPSSYVGSYVTVKLSGLMVTTDRDFPADFSLTIVSGNQYTVVTSSSTEAKIKVLAAVDSKCKVSVKVNDGVNTSNAFEYVINIVVGSEKPKSKPVGYSIATGTQRQ